MKCPSQRICSLLEKAQVTSLFTLPNLLAFKGKHIFAFHALATGLSMLGTQHKEKSKLKTCIEGITGLGLFSIAFSKMTMQKRARLFYGANGLMLVGLAALSAYRAAKDSRITWSDAASRAQDDLDKGVQVSEENKNDMGDHAAA